MFEVVQLIVSEVEYVTIELISPYFTGNGGGCTALPNPKTFKSKDDY